MNRAKIAVFILAISIPISVCEAQEGETSSIKSEWGSIGTDRPGEGSDSPFLLPTGAIQFENGFFFQHDNPELDGANVENQSFSLPSGLIRLGLSKNIEMRIGYGHLREAQITNGETESINGLAPLSVGSKIFICNEKGLRPQMALITSLTFPSTGKEEFQVDYISPTMRLLASHSINQWLGITTNLVINWDDALTEAIVGYAAYFELSLANKLGGFVEFYGFIPEESSTDHRLNGGLTYLVTDNFQLDTSAGVAFTEDVPDYYVSIGLSVRTQLFKKP